MKENRPCHQMRKEGDEECVIKKVMLLDDAGAAIDQRQDLRDGEERDAERQDEMQKRNVRPKCHVDAGKEKVEVFVEGKQRDIARNAQPENAVRKLLPVRCIRPQDSPAEQIVDEDAADEKRQVVNIPIAVKTKACQHQPDIRQTAAARKSSQQEITCHDNWQEDKEKEIRIKKHPRGSLPLSRKNFMFLQV